jgi:hypothetical protein
MKKTILTFSFFIGVAIAANAQQTPGTTAAGTVNPNEKPKSAVELSKQNAATTTATSADSAMNAGASTQKKTVKRSCCKKHTEGQPCGGTPATPAVKPKSSAADTKQR